MHVGRPVVNCDLIRELAGGREVGDGQFEFADNTGDRRPFKQICVVFEKAIAAAVRGKFQGEIELGCASIDELRPGLDYQAG